MNTTNTRTYVVTGAASGIGLETKRTLEGLGHRVIGVDLSGTEVIADLSTEQGRSDLRQAVIEAGGERLDAVLAVAGVSNETPVPVRVNYFGAKATLEELRPLLSASKAPRAAVVSSFASIAEGDEVLLDALRADREADAVARADELSELGEGQRIYGTTKRALVEWIRAQSILPDWAGEGIPLNAVAPGITQTPLAAPLFKTEEYAREIMRVVPMPLNGIAQPRVIADLLVFLTSEQNSHVTGQNIFIDGGAEASIRGPRV